MSEAVDCRPVKAKLKAYGADHPDEPRHIADFASLLADYINPEIYPESIKLAVSMVLLDLSRGRSGFPSIALPSSLIGLQPIMVSTLELYAPVILGECGGEPLAKVLREAE